MASPFPGMDPYLEGPEWPDFHYTFVNYWREAIADALPDDYLARIDERMYLVETDPEVRKLIKPDVSIETDNGGSSARRTSAIATLEPVTMRLEIIDGVTEHYVEILRKPELTVVAILELLSPTNKEGPGRTEYLHKRNAILRQNVHLVELDLLLGGRRLPSPRSLPSGDCYYLIARAEQRFDCQLYHWRLTDPLPTLPVPLRPPHADIAVDLAAVFRTAYQRGRFARSLRYDRPCPAPLTEEQRAWAERILRRPSEPEA
ncbi:MAG: DUF4058 family protein [Planctomycetes bacterium]|nr:DUF4058 family protein [Planctomycetota bacterium]